MHSTSVVGVEDMVSFVYNSWQATFTALNHNISSILGICYVASVISAQLVSLKNLK